MTGWACEPENPFYIAGSAIPSNKYYFLAMFSKLIAPCNKSWPHNFNHISAFDTIMICMKTMNICVMMVPFSTRESLDIVIKVVA
jgi:hypothetical protein